MIFLIFLSKINDNTPMHPNLQQLNSMRLFLCKYQCTLPCDHVQVRYYGLTLDLQHHAQQQYFEIEFTRLDCITSGK